MVRRGHIYTSLVADTCLLGCIQLYVPGIQMVNSWWEGLCALVTLEAIPVGSMISGRLKKCC